MESYADYTNDRNIGRLHEREGGLYWSTSEEAQRFSVPTAGEFGTREATHFAARACKNGLNSREAVRYTSLGILQRLEQRKFRNPAATLANAVSLGRITRSVRTVGCLSADTPVDRSSSKLRPDTSSNSTSSKVVQQHEIPFGRFTHVHKCPNAIR